MSDKLVFDLAQEVEGSPNVFVRKDWVNILDNNNQNYNNNQSIIDTSQLSNSNKYMSYREAYLQIPMLITVAEGTGLTLTNVTGAALTGAGFLPATAASSLDYGVGLKNWFGQIIHSFTLDYNGTTIVQQTPYINMWNSFKLMTSLSYNDLTTQGPTIGFYPDSSLSWSWNPNGTNSLNGNGVTNNTNTLLGIDVTGQFNNFESNRGNDGYLLRQTHINFDIDGPLGAASTYGTLLQGGISSLQSVWKSYVSRKINSSVLSAASDIVGNRGVLQYSVLATVYLKHVHSFFNMCPLLKGVFMKMTMNLNNSTSTIQVNASSAGAGNLAPAFITCTNVTNSLGGVNPLMISSADPNQGNAVIFPVGTTTAAGSASKTIKYNVSVGSVCLDTNMTSENSNIGLGTLSKSIYLYVPAYTFNPVFEQAYLSNPIKSIKYTDVYQYQVINVQPNQPQTSLLTNGIANVKSVLVLPFYNASGANSGFVSGIPVFQSPFDPAGTGPTSPMCWLTNFNIQVSGQNAIYNMERYNFEQFNNQLYGCNAVNGGLTDGITSGLINRQDFDMEYSYYYVNIERMLPVEQSVPKSIQLLCQNLSSRNLDLYCFIEYGNEVSIDILTGSRV
jgi:hypothetical protein